MRIFSTPIDFVPKTPTCTIVAELKESTNSSAGDKSDLEISDGAAEQGFYLRNINVRPFQRTPQDEFLLALIPEALSCLTDSLD